MKLSEYLLGSLRWKVTLNITYNTGDNLTFPKGKEFELEKSSDILNLLGEITIGLRNMKVK